MIILEKLIEDYNRIKSVITEKEKTGFETSIWNQAITENKRDGARNKPTFLQKVLGGDLYDYIYRSNIEHAPDFVWKEVENKKYKLYLISKAFYEGKKQGRDDINQFKKVFYECLNGGKDKVKLKKSTKKQHKEEKNNNYWEQVSQLTLDFLNEELNGVDPISSEKFRQDLEKDLKIVIDDHKRRLYNIKRERQEKEPKFYRSKVLNACNILHMDPPSPGGQVNLDKAKKQKKRLAREYHPDSHGGDETFRSKYSAVLEAYSVLEQYFNSFKNEGK